MEQSGDISGILDEAGNIFICYAHADNANQDSGQRWLDRLLELIKPLVRQRSLKVWSDQDIKIGEHWHYRIKDQLSISAAVVLLVSPAFLASDYIATTELPILLKNAAARGVVIIPLIISPCLYEEATFKYPNPLKGPECLKLSSIQSVNPPSRTLIEMSEAEQNRALLKVARRLAEINENARNVRLEELRRENAQYNLKLSKMMEIQKKDPFSRRRRKIRP